MYSFTQLIRYTPNFLDDRQDQFDRIDLFLQVVKTKKL